MPASILPTRRGPSAFRWPDAEGMPSNWGTKYHGALDWFGAEGQRTPVRCPVVGEVVEVRPSRGRTGQVFGGVVKVEEAGTGRVYVCRHIDPAESLRVGAKLRPGDLLGRVTAWADGGDHIHLEVWRSLRGGYDFENALDPGTLDWSPYLMAPVPKQTQHELRTPPYGNTLRLVWGENEWAGWPECAGPIKWIAAHGAKRNPRRSAISWRGNIWRGPKPVANVCKRLMRDHLMRED